jgi:V/A-type H+-transporting ATPase subunit K
MVAKMNTKTMALLMLAAVAALVTFAPATAFAQDDHGAGDAAPAGSKSTGDGLATLGIAIGAGIAIAGGALATGRAQAAVGAGGTGALAEKPELFGSILILFAIPETLVIFAFVIAIMLYTKIA